MTINGGWRHVLSLEIVGILLATLAALFVFTHAWTRGLSIWAALAWAAGTFLLLIVVLPIYLIIRPKGRPTDDNDE